MTATLGGTVSGSYATLSGSNPAALSGAAAPGATGQAADAGHIHDVSGLATISALSGLVPFSWIVGHYYQPVGINGLVVGVANGLANGNAIYVPILVPASQTINKIGVYLDAAGSVGALLRMALYSDSGMLPNALLGSDTGTTPSTGAATGTGYVEFTFGSPVAVTRGILWASVAAQGAPATTPGARKNSNGLTWPGGGYTAGDNACQGQGGAFEQTGITGAFPATATPTIRQSSIPIVVVRCAS